MSKTKLNTAEIAEIAKKDRATVALENLTLTAEGVATLLHGVSEHLPANHWPLLAEGLAVALDSAVSKVEDR